MMQLLNMYMVYIEEVSEMCWLALMKRKTSRRDSSVNPSFPLA